jgi:aminoacylase
MYKHFVDGVKLSGISVVPAVFPAATDSRFLRALGIRALGFSPMRNSEILLHEYNENLKVCVFEEGLEVYVKLIEHITMQPDRDD